MKRDSHEGYVGNEVADKLAKRGATNRSNDPGQVYLSLQVFKSRIRDAFFNQHNDIWANCLGNRVSKLRFPTINPVKSRNIIRLSRLQIGKLMPLFFRPLRVKLLFV